MRVNRRLTPIWESEGWVFLLTSELNCNRVILQIDITTSEELNIAKGALGARSGPRAPSSTRDRDGTPKDRKFVVGVETDNQCAQSAGRQQAGSVMLPRIHSTSVKFSVRNLRAVSLSPWFMVHCAFPHCIRIARGNAGPAIRRALSSPAGKTLLWP